MHKFHKDNAHPFSKTGDYVINRFKPLYGHGNAITEINLADYGRLIGLNLVDGYVSLCRPVIHIYK